MGPEAKLYSELTKSIFGKIISLFQNNIKTEGARQLAAALMHQNNQVTYLE